MPSIRIQVSDHLLAEVDRLALPMKQTRGEFVSRAIRDAIHRREQELIREAYLKQPDDDSPADDWADAEEWNPN